MQALLIVSLAVAALAESDPQLLLNPYAATVGSPFVSSLAYGMVQPTIKVQKIEKPVEVKAYNVETAENKFQVPALSYKTPVVGAVATPVTTYSANWPYASPVAVNAYTTGVVGTQETIVPASYHAKNGAVKHTVYKREAEADPALLYANAFGVSPYVSNAYTGVSPYVSNVYSGVYPSVYSTPYVSAASKVAYSTPYVSGYTYPYATVPVASSVKTYANDAVRPENYAAKGQYVAQSAGAIHIAKREAEADPAVVYSSGFPYAASTLYNAYNTIPRVYSGYSAALPSVYGYNYNTLAYNNYVY